MEGNEEESLQRLAKLRRQRPDYRRVISTEFGVAGNPPEGTDQVDSNSGCPKPCQGHKPETGECTTTPNDVHSSGGKMSRRAMFQELPYYDAETIPDQSLPSLDFLSDPPLSEPSEERYFQSGAHDFRLSDMCLEALRHGGQSRRWYRHLPVGVRKQLAGRARTCRLKSARFRWVSRILDLAEKTHGKREWIIWDLDRPMPPRVWMPPQPSNNTYSVGMFMGVNTTSYFGYNQVLPIVAMTLAIDSMLPSYLDETFQENMTSDITVHEAHIRHIRRKMKNRYPTVTEKLFDMALPYVWWRRGFCKRATEKFANLAQYFVSYEKGGLADMILREAGRMCLEAGQINEACRLFYVSIDREDDEVGLRDTVACLCARSFCSGDLTPSKFANAKLEGEVTVKAQLSLSIWDRHDSHLLQAVVENQLCFFTGMASDVREGWLLELRRQLQSMVRDEGPLYHHLSFIEAMLQNSDKAASRYNDFYGFHRGGVGDQLNPDPDTHLNPWSPLIGRLQFQRDAIKPLRIKWRTPLDYPHLDFEKSKGYSQSRTGPHLRLEGEYLVADISTNLPFRASIVMDPQTGRIINPKCHELPWMAGSRQKDSRYIYDGGFPRSVQIFENIHGASVELIESHIPIPRRYPVSRETVLIAEMFRMDSSGFVQKLDLYKIAREAHLKETRAYIKAELDAESIDLAKKIQLEEILSKRYANNLVFNYQLLLDLLKNKKNEQQMSKKGKKGVKGKKAKSTVEDQSVGYSMHMDSLYTFGSTAVVTMCIDHMQRDHDQRSVHCKCVIFVNCETSESFLNPKIHTSKTGSVLIHSMPEVGSKNAVNHFPKASYWLTRGSLETPHRVGGIHFKRICDNFRALFIRQGSYPIVYDKHGEEVRESLFTKPQPLMCSLSHSFGGHLYGCLDNAVLYVEKGEVHEFELLPADQTLKTFRFDEGKVFLLTDLGFCLLHLPTMEQCALFLSAPQHSLSQLSDGDITLFGNYRSLAILTSQRISPDAARGIVKNDVTRYVIALINHLLILEVDDNSNIASVIFHEPLPGQAHEAYLISETRGILVCASLHDSREDRIYREIVYHYSYDGTLLGVLPFLGPGPRCFTSGIFSSSDKDNESEKDNACTRIFFLDGHDAIACIDLC